MSLKRDGKGETITRGQRVVSTTYENLDTSNAVTINEGDWVAVMGQGDSTDDDFVVGEWVTIAAASDSTGGRWCGVAKEAVTIAAGAKGAIKVIVAGFARRISAVASTADGEILTNALSGGTAGQAARKTALTTVAQLGDSKDVAVSLTAVNSVLKNDDGYAHFHDVETEAGYVSGYIFDSGFFPHH